MKRGWDQPHMVPDEHTRLGWARPAWRGWMIAVLAVCVLSSVCLASVAVTPARIEVEVEAEGTIEPLFFFNRGDRIAWVRAYAGLGAQSPSGATVYLDDPGARNEAARWVKLEHEVFTIDPGEGFHLAVRFLPQEGSVSYYPVIFAEVGAPPEEDRPEAEAADPGIRSVARVAVPVLATYAATRDVRQVHGEVESVTLRSVGEEAALDIQVSARNRGNVHGWIQGRIRIMDSAGDLIDTLIFPEVRILPGAGRVLEARWPLPGRAGALRIMADILGEGWPGEGTSLALELPEVPRISLGALHPRIEWLTAERFTGDDQVAVEGGLRFPAEADQGQIETGSTIRIDVRDAAGRSLVDGPVSTALETGATGLATFSAIVPVKSARLAASVSAHLYEGEVSKAYAAATLPQPEGIETEVASRLGAGGGAEAP